MICYFPDLDSLCLAITSGVVPPAVSLAATVAGIDEQGHLWLQPSIALPRGAQTALRRLGVQFVKANGELQGEEYCCWLQLLPLQREASAPTVSNQMPVLFELPDPAQLPELVSEVLRLGNDRQSFRYLQEDAQTRILLRVIGPPYYSLLRALEPDGPTSAPRAYLERAPRVWVEIGYTHPLIEQIRPATGMLLLMRPPHDWISFDDAPFRDIYDILEFTLPQAPVQWSATELSQRLRVPLQLIPSNTTEPAELWVLRERAEDQIDALVRDADDQLLSRLSFAVGEFEGHKSIVLRVRPSKLPPPVLVLQGRSFRPYLKLSNLFVPCGQRLQPPLRRDALRKLLAEDPARVTWLYPRGEGGFVPEDLPDQAFQPLANWVDYVIDRERQPLQAWLQAMQFDFEGFICKEDQPSKPRPPSGKEKPSAPLRSAETIGDEPAPESAVQEVKKRRSSRAPDDQFAALVRTEPSELQLRLTELEKRFLSLEGPQVAAERQALWPSLAAINTTLGNASEAAICWLNSFWDIDQVSLAWASHWARSEAHLANSDATGADFDRLLAIAHPTHADLRALTACIVWAANCQPPAPALKQRLPQVRRYLEQHEALLSVRGVWLAWESLTHLAAGDVLGLVRTRDRLLERLLTSGLSPELDLPSFLRFSGQNTADRFRRVRERLRGLHRLARRWVENETYTAAYVDLIFAFGLARIGETSACQEIRHQAKAVLGAANYDVHSFLLEAYEYRIEQVLAGSPGTGPLPPEHIEYLEQMERFSRYAVDRLRHHSRILEPHEKVDPYRLFHLSANELGKDLSREIDALPDLTDRQLLAKRIKQLVQVQRPPKVQLRVLSATIQFAPRIGESFAVDLLDRIAPVLNALPARREPIDLEAEARLLERALFVAAHFDRVEQVQAIVARFLSLLDSQQGDRTFQVLNALAGQCFRGLRKLGLRDEVDHLLQHMSNLVLQGQRLEVVRKRAGTSWPAALQTLLHIAAGWLYFGRMEQAIPVLNEVRDLLLEGNLIHHEKTALACLYTATLGQASVDLALQRIEELFQQMKPIPDTYTTNKYYARSQLEVVEAVVLAVVNEEFAAGTATRRWLDDEEYLVRRRIHHDVRTLMNQTGL